MGEEGDQNKLLSPFPLLPAFIHPPAGKDKLLPFCGWRPEAQRTDMVSWGTVTRESSQSALPTWLSAGASVASVPACPSSPEGQECTHSHKSGLVLRSVSRGRLSLTSALRTEGKPRQDREVGSALHGPSASIRRYSLLASCARPWGQKGDELPASTKLTAWWGQYYRAGHVVLRAGEGHR